ncbi:hypothetical protein CEXT_684691 [Caerostris extrusa]|uniref:Uncharacterized protein n=1 Tax=Caerostris extrusa TaxID=172846 RepID=A0AAV4XFI1_CAEEX|nr:hypothetical protein CEXT_684691 [Caerostris extrusa]
MSIIDCIRAEIARIPSRSVLSHTRQEVCVIREADISSTSCQKVGLTKVKLHREFICARLSPQAVRFWGNPWHEVMSSTYSDRQMVIFF